MTLRDIRQVKTLDQLKPAIKFLCDNMQAMNYGEFHSYKRTIEHKARELRVDLKTINKIAKEYQVAKALNVEYTE